MIRDLPMINKTTNTFTWVPDSEKIIRERRSVRSYQDTPLTLEQKNRMLAALNSGRNPFHSAHRFKMIETRSDEVNKDALKLGTYGVIKGANNYLLSAISNGEDHLEALGFDMEYAVLQAQSEGLGTCWLGGTFNKSQFAQALQLQSNEYLPIVIPYGFPAKQEGIMGRMIRSIAGSKNRLPFETIFFNKTYGNPLTTTSAGKFSTALEMIRLGPSASNKQPWRIIKDENTIHFYLQATKGYSKGLGFDIQRVDMGIAICHFDAIAVAQNIEGHFQKLPGYDNEKINGLQYIISFVGK